MLKLKRIQLFGKLDQTAYKALESATVLCKTRGNPYVDLTHFINQILLGGSSDLHEILRRFEIDEARGFDLTTVERKNLVKMQAALEECIEYHDRLHEIAIFTLVPLPHAAHGKRRTAGLRDGPRKALRRKRRIQQHLRPQRTVVRGARGEKDAEPVLARRHVP